MQLIGNRAEKETAQSGDFGSTAQLTSARMAMKKRFHPLLMIF